MAAAIRAAQTGNVGSFDTSRSFKAPPKPSSQAAPRPPPSPASTSRPPAPRAPSPSEALAATARALSPVRYFLRPSDLDEDGEPSGEGFASFSSIGNGTNRSAGEVSYDYHAEDEYVRAAQAQVQAQAPPRRGQPSRMLPDTSASSDLRRRRGRSEDMPYRPEEDDYIDDSEDSAGEGDGIVRMGGLAGRADTRGKRKEKGEGYLGMGLGFQPRERSKRDSRGQSNGLYTGEGDDHDNSQEILMDDRFEDERSYLGQPAARNRSHSPFEAAAAQANGFRRSPTPSRLIRALTPKSPGTPGPSRRRQPAPARVAWTNIVHGVAISLRFLVEAITAVLRTLFVNPVLNIFGSGKQFARKAKQDWWKWLGGLLALSLAIRILNRAQGQGMLSVPDMPPSSMDELISRLTRLEHSLSALSDTSRKLERAEGDTRRATDAIGSRLDSIESTIASGTDQVETGRQSTQKGVTDLRGEVDSLKAEVRGLLGRVNGQDKSVSSAVAAQRTMDAVKQELRHLKDRVGVVERDVRDALDDGRLRRALEKILPSQMPIRKSASGLLDIDPVFWTEMNKVLAGRSDVEQMIRKAIASVPRPNEAKQTVSAGLDEHDLEKFGERLFSQKAREGVFIAKSEFLRILESEVSNLRHIIDELPRRPPSAAAPQAAKSTSVTVKAAKGEDITSALQSLIDAALLRYSKDTIAKPDYALFTAGGRVVPSITSDTLVLHQPGALGKFVLGKKPIEGRAPATALHPDISVGSCWPFKGSRGQLGVLLTTRVKVGDITVEHAPKDMALDVGSAPQRIEVVSALRTPAPLQRGLTFCSGVSWTARRTRQRYGRITTGWPSTGKHSLTMIRYTCRIADLRSNLPPSAAPEHILLANITYDPSAPHHIQTFPVLPEVVELGVDLGIVIFKIESNWGADFTCLYRVRVHGEPLRPELEAE